MAVVTRKIINLTPVLIIVPILLLFLWLNAYYNSKRAVNSTNSDITSNSQITSTAVDTMGNSVNLTQDLNVDNDSLANQPSNIHNANNSRSANYVDHTYKNTPDYELNFEQLNSNTNISSLVNIQNGISEQWDPAWNDEAQMYTNNNVSIQDGSLVLNAQVEEDNQITSGRIDTKGIFETTYGKFEIVAKLPSGIGTFPALWLLPVDGGTYFRDNIATPSELNNEISWQGGGEIDIAEALGTLPGEIYHDVHTYNSIVANAGWNSGSTKLQNESTEYHTYAVEWSPDSIIFSVDGVQTHAVYKKFNDFRNWPFDRPFYLIINLAMGGNWNKYFIGNTYPHGVNTSTNSNWNLSIKSIKHFALEK